MRKLGLHHNLYFSNIGISLIFPRLFLGSKSVAYLEFYLVVFFQNLGTLKKSSSVCWQRFYSEKSLFKKFYKFFVQSHLVEGAAYTDYMRRLNFGEIETASWGATLGPVTEKQLKNVGARRGSIVSLS